MLIFCFSNHSFLQKWLFFSPLQAPLSPSHCQGLSELFLFPLPTGEKPNPTHLLLAWQRGTAGTCVSAGRQGWLCYAVVLGPWKGFVQILKGLQEKHMCGRERVSLPACYDMQGTSLCSWPAPYPPCPVNETPSQMAGRKDPFLKNELRSLPDFFSACPLNKLGVPETVVQPPRTRLRFSFHS